jgi:hypothetical protein
VHECATSLVEAHRNVMLLHRFLSIQKTGSISPLGLNAAQLIKLPQRTKARHTIEIRSTTTLVRRAAILSTNPDSDYSVISQMLVTKVLCEPIHPLDKEDAKPNEGGYEQQTDGYVDLDWCLKKDKKRVHRTRFLVSSTYNPSFDAVLGKKDALQYGIM